MYLSIFCILLAVPIITASNYTTTNFRVEKSQFATMAYNKTIIEFSIEVYSPDQLTFNQVSSSYSACHGYYCLGNPDSILLPAGSFGRCPTGYFLVMFGGNYYCTNTDTLNAIGKGQSPVEIALFIILLFIYFDRRRKRTKLERQ